jgi:cleavage stimulation factor subunit 2
MGRKLRVDFSNETPSNDDSRNQDGAVRSQKPSTLSPHTTNHHLQTGGGGMNYPNPTTTNGGSGANPPMNTMPPMAPGGGGGSSLPPLPQGKDLPPGVTCTDAISRTLNTLPPAQLLDILQQMKTLATTDPARATELLNQAPQLSYAVFQALLIMGLVSPDAINSVLEPGAAAAAPPQSMPMPMPMPMPMQMPMQMQMPIPAPYGGGAPATGTPPVMGGGYAPPPPPHQAAAAAAPAPAPAGQDPEALMRAVMELPQETIDQLPEAERQQIMALRASYAAQGRR